MKYKIVAKYISEKISNGTFKSGKRLPSIRVLSKELGYNKATIIKAYELLESKHIVYSIPKSGYYPTSDTNFPDNTEDIIDFSQLTPDVKLLPFREFNHCVNKAIEKYKNDLFNYSDSQGLYTLRDTLSRYFSTHDIYGNAQNICITSGAHQAISILTAMTFSGKGQKILIEQPTYNEMYNIIATTGCEYETITRGSHGLNLDEVDAAFKTGKLKFFYTMPRHHNPLGTNLPKTQMIKLLELAKKYDVYIVEDDYLAEIKTKKPTLPLHYYDLDNKVIYLRSFSKSFMPGIRLGCAIFPSELKSEFTKIKRSYDLNTSPLVQGALELYISNGMYKAHIDKINNVYNKKNATFRQQLAILDSDQKHITPSNRGFIFYMNLYDIVDSTTFTQHLLNYGVKVSDGKQFYAQEKSSNCLRLSFSSLSESQIRHGINTIYSELAKFI